MTAFFLEYRNMSIIFCCALIITFLSYLYFLSFKFKPMSLFITETSYPVKAQFAVIAIMFLLFDIEVLYLFPLVNSLYSLVTLDVYIILGFYTLLLIGLLYEISRKVLDFQTYRITLKESRNKFSQKENLLNVKIKKYFFVGCFFISVLILNYVFNYFSWNTFGLFVKSFISINILSFLLFHKYYNLKASAMFIIAFMANSFIFLLYIFGISQIIKGLPNPILVTDLSLLSHYRYLTYCIVFLVGCVIYITAYIYIRINKILEVISYPYLQENVRTVLDTIMGLFLHKQCAKITNYILMYSRYRGFYFCIHFIFHYLIRIITTLLFFHFVFFLGDLRILLYLMPFMLISWILRFLFYYHIKTIEESQNHLKKCMTIKINTLPSDISNDSIFKKYNIQALGLELTEFGYNEGLLEKHYPVLLQAWLDLVEITNYISNYKNKTNFINKILLAISIICWFNITFTFFFMENKKILNLDPNKFWGYFSFIKRSFHTTRPNCSPHEKYWLFERAQNNARVSSNQQYSPGHMVYGEMQPNGIFRIFGTFTSKATTNNPDTTPIFLSNKRLDGKPGNQYYIPFKKYHDVPVSDLANYQTNPTITDPIIQKILDTTKSKEPYIP